jgi:23S rRNA pseudouridine1911/1915/1917 synthase
VNTDPDKRIERHVASPDDEGVRLDVFLASRVEDLSRNQIQKLIKNDCVTVNSKARPANYQLKGGDAVEIAVPDRDEGERAPVPQNIPVRVVYEDDDLVVINKDPGIVVHPAHGNWDGTIVNALLGRGTTLSSLGGNDRPGVVHRLDKDTSGVLVLAKSDRAYRGLSEQIKEREFKKVYHAISWGNIGAASRIIEAPIARHPVHRQRMAVAKRGGREAYTEVFVVDTFEHFDYIRVITVTGRTHQIRVHMAHISHPILGDSVYSGRRNRGVPPAVGALLKTMQRQALHASMISFAHPNTGRRLEFTTALPTDMRKTLEVLYRDRE